MRIDTITLSGADDFHHHLRDGELMHSLAGPVSKQFSRCIVMPNLTPPITNAKMALEYRDAILSSPGVMPGFTPLMTLYLTDSTSPQDIIDAAHVGVIAVKLYPAGVTTNSSSGVTDIQSLYPVLQQMVESNLLLLVHGEVADPSCDMFHRESQFVSTTLPCIVDRFPHLRVVLEHCSTREAVDFVLSAGDNVAATVTAHHLLDNRSALFDGGKMRPHNYCLPIIKTEDDRQALLHAVTTSSKFFAGTDSAPHPRHRKEFSECSAGCFTALNALELYAEAFDSIGQVDKLSDFVSGRGARFYNLAPPDENISRTLVRKTSTVCKEFKYGATDEETVVPYRYGQTLSWSLIAETK